MARSPHSDLDSLREFLASCDAPCSGCGYNLRGLTQATCPECGRSISLRQLESRRYDPAHAVGYMGLLGGIMFLAAPLAPFMVLAAISAPNGVVEIVLFGFVVAGQIAAMILWERREQRIRAMRGAVRWSLAVACWSWIAVVAVAIAWVSMAH